MNKQPVLTVWKTESRDTYGFTSESNIQVDQRALDGLSKVDLFNQLVQLFDNLGIPAKVTVQVSDYTDELGRNVKGFTKVIGSN